MFTSSHKIIAVALAVSAIASGCGDAAYRTTPNTNITTATTGTTAVTATTTTSSTTSSSSVSAATSSGVPPLSFTVQGLGYTTPVTFTVSTRTVLMVEFTPTNQLSTTGNYSQLGVYINVGSTAGQGGETLATPLLPIGVASGVMDFSAAFTQTCASTDTTCRQNVVITINKPNDDYYCMSFGMYCPYTNALSTQHWYGTLSVQTDDTESL